MSDELNNIITIKVSKEFKGLMGGLWLGMEEQVVVSSDQDAINQFIKRNELLEKAYMAMNPQINWSPLDSRGLDVPYMSTNPTTVKTETKDERIQSFIATINMCTSLKFLKNFETRVHQENNQELLDAYNKKLSEFL